MKKRRYPREKHDVQRLRSRLRSARRRPQVLLLNARRIDREGVELILLALEDITARRLAEENVKKLNTDLQHNLDELASANKELEAFSYSVSHDLRNPLNRILGFSDVLLEGYSDKLDDEGKTYLNRVIKNATRMNRIMDDLLHLSRISRHGVQRQDVDLSKLAASVVAELREAQPDRGATVDIQEGIAAFADAKLIEVALSNLLGNAWKFTSKIKNARIQFGTFRAGRENRLLCEGQRGRLRSKLLRKAVFTVPSPAFGGGVRRDRHRPRYGAAHHPSPRREGLG